MSQLDSLIDTSFEVKKNSYNKYSNFRVGAALLCKDGTVFQGTNVENASYSLAICAERSAIVSAVSQGQKYFDTIVVSSDLDDYIYPCGSCRQFISEFGSDIKVVVTKPDRSYLSCPISDLLPHAFSKQALDQNESTLSTHQK